MKEGKIFLQNFAFGELSFCWETVPAAASHQLYVCPRSAVDLGCKTLSFAAVGFSFENPEGERH